MISRDAIPPQRVVVMSDALRASPQEGAQVVAGEIARHCADVHHGETLAPTTERGRGFSPVLKGPLFGLTGALALLRRRGASFIYLPQNGLTLATIVRATLILLLANPRSLDIVVLQHHIIPRRILGLLGGNWNFVVATLEQERLFQQAGLQVTMLVPRVPATKLSAKRSREDARDSLGWDDRPKYLHVGHARRGRNLQALNNLRRHGTLHLVLSDYRAEDADALPVTGDHMEVHRGMCSDLADRYRAADVYVFPTVDSHEVIGVPMSIFEALGNGTPVVARRSAVLERWANQPGLHLSDNDEELIRMAVAIGRRSERIEPQAAISSSICVGDLSPCRLAAHS
jgi:hypothetical protein